MIRYRVKTDRKKDMRGALKAIRRVKSRQEIANYLDHPLYWIEDLMANKSSCTRCEAQYITDICGGTVEYWFDPYDPYKSRRGPKGSTVKNTIRNYTLNDPMDEVHRLKNGMISVDFLCADGKVHSAYGPDIVVAKKAAEKRKAEIKARMG